MADIIEALKNGLVFYVFGVMFLYLLASGTNLSAITTIGNFIGSLIVAIPFFLMGLVSKLLD